MKALIFFASLLALAGCTAQPAKEDAAAGEDNMIKAGWLIQVRGGVLACTGEYPEKLICFRAMPPPSLCVDTGPVINCNPPDQGWPEAGKRTGVRVD